MYQAIEAGGRLHTPEDALDRALNLGRFLSGQDAYFSYPGATHEVSGPGPPVTPGTVMSLSKSDGKVASRVDIVPRDEEAMERYGPQFQVRPTDDDAGRAAAERLHEALREGTFVEIAHGLDVTVTRMPPGFSDLVGEQLTGTVQIGPAQHPRPRAEPWRARLRATSDEGDADLVVTMRQRDVVPDGWDDAFECEHGGLNATLLFRRHGTGGGLRWNVRYTRNDSPVRDQLAAMNFLQAASGTGELVVSASERTGSPALRFPTHPEPISEDALALLALLEDLRVIETWSGVSFTLPENISGLDARDVAVVAKLVRDRGRPVTWSNFEMAVTHARPLRSGGVVRVEFEMAANVLGRVVDLGYLRMQFSDYVVASDEPVERPKGHRVVRIEPATEASSKMVAQLVKDKTQGTRRPPPPPRRRGNRGKGRKR